MPAKPPAPPSRPPRRAPPAQGPAHAPRTARPEVAATGRVLDLDALQALLDSLPATFDGLDVVQIDGYLCGLLLQPQPVPEARWLPPVIDLDGKQAPTRFDRESLAATLRARLDELHQAIAGRQWFDPWIYELDEEATPGEMVLPWVAGFATAVDLFPALMDEHEDALLEPLATLYRHFDPEDLEDADELLAEIETLAPPESLDEAVEDLVRSVLLMADVVHPQAAARPAAPRQGAGAPLRRRTGAAPAGPDRAPPRPDDRRGPRGPADSAPRSPRSRGAGRSNPR
ncbi:MAG: hypothetical protein RIQ53_538 [Pseudomonadota bacterium]|jgi:uncharacterized protein